MDQKCDKKAKCMDCANGENIHNEPNCFSKDFHSYKLKEFSKLTSNEEGEDQYNEIADLIISFLNSNGPVVCNMKHSGNLFKYRTSIIEKYTDIGDLNEYSTWVSIVGFKTLSSEPESQTVWMVRHSFGDNVGHYGLIYVNADPTVNSFDILDNCYALVVDPTVEVVHNSDKKMKNLFQPISMAPFDIRIPRYSFPKIESKLTTDEGLQNDEETPIFWGNINNVNYLTWVKNQHIPTYCGSCWVQSATSVINDRLNIQNMKQQTPWPRTVLSTQAPINCRFGGTCLGGDAGLVFEKASQWKIPVETCRVYESHNPDVFGCIGESRCSLADKNGSWTVDNFNGVYVDHWEYARGEAQMKKHLKDGPISCSFEVTDEFENYKASTDKRVVFEQKKSFFQVNHVVAVVGWDTDQNGLYWIVRNSWGVEYGYQGMFYIRAGNVLGLEAGCQVPTKFRFETWQ
jgi:cathepsin X